MIASVLTSPRAEVVARLAAQRAENLARIHAEQAAVADARMTPPQAVATGGGEAALGNNADFASHVDGATTYDIHAVLPPPSTVVAWYLRSYGRETLSRVQILSASGRQARIRFCGSKISRGGDGVGLYARPDRGYGRVSGVCVCGQSLACPVCAPRIAAFRGAEVAEGFKRAVARGYEPRLVTFTTPHTLGSTLGKEVDCFGFAWRNFNRGRKVTERNAHSLGHQLGRECTYSEKHGWHYHQHQLRFDEPGSFCEDTMRVQWLTALDGVGRKWRGAELHAFDAGLVGNEAGARYIAKLATSVEAQGRAVGLEVAGGSLKGKNLATLLKAAATGDEQAEKVWVGGVADIVRRKISSVRWSRGFRAELGMVGEKTDEQIAADEVLKSDVFLGALNPYQWRGILKWRAEFALCCAANQGEAAVNSFLQGLELGQLNDADPRALWRKSNKEGF